MPSFYCLVNHEYSLAFPLLHVATRARWRVRLEEMKEETLKRIRIVRFSGIVMFFIGIIGIFWQYHDIARCSTATTGSNCGFALNTEGIGFALIFTGMIMIIGSYVVSAFIKDGTDK